MPNPATQHNVLLFFLPSHLDGFMGVRRKEERGHMRFGEIWWEEVAEGACQSRGVGSKYMVVVETVALEIRFLGLTLSLGLLIPKTGMTEVCWWNELPLYGSEAILTVLTAGFPYSLLVMICLYVLSPIRLWAPWGASWILHLFVFLHKYCWADEL